MKPQGDPKGFDRLKTLEELESENWGMPNFDSHLVEECHRLRRIPLKDFTVENLRIMIGQNIGLDYLMPLALEKLEQNPVAEGDFYPGDLLVSVLRVNSSFWAKFPELKRKVKETAEAAVKIPTITENELKSIRIAYNSFLGATLVR